MYANLVNTAPIELWGFILYIKDIFPEVQYNFLFCIIVVGTISKIPPSDAPLNQLNTSISSILFTLII